ncbi:recombinase family protein [Haloarcula sp. Atlit-7R]|uniref:recombinase family protein n=1 Tax=Haloarcula sp. Atlit-7R TaxID=2282125 RepID=UPI000EF13BE5|nr:recombinase family protein [Haloarcula sp. Atlit-7R]RLM87894.1 recombinase family protein [Haloarcula sp. Atlit-7R]
MSSRAVAVIRKSQGADDDVALQLQREEVPALAHDLAEEVETVDLGVHTGFSVHTKSVDDERIDAHPEVEELLADLRSGEYDHLVAYDDTRLARDQFYWELKRAATLGECELAFVEEPPEDELTFRVQRAVESDVKRREIEKSQAALDAREERGDDHGRPPFGLRFDEDGRRWVPDRESGEFATALEVVRCREEGLSWRDVEEETGVSRSTARGIYDRRERYLQEAEASVS